jgi:hypothetical protein
MREKIITFLSLTGIDKFPDVMAAGFAEQIRSQFNANKSNEPLPEGATKAVELMTSTLAAKKSVLFDTVVEEYAKAFSESEIDQLVEFYSTPVGRRVVELGGIVLPSVVEAGNAWSTSALNGIEGELSELLS